MNFASAATILAATMALAPSSAATSVESRRDDSPDLTSSLRRKMVGTGLPSSSMSLPSSIDSKSHKSKTSRKSKSNKDQQVVLSHQATPGTCNAESEGFGCYFYDGTGNPVNLVNCFSNDQIQPPFGVDAVRFWLATGVEPPDTMSVRIWSGNEASGPDSSDATSFLYEQVIPPGTYSTGANTIAMNNPVVINTNEFCAGVFSGPHEDGFVLSTEAGSGTKSYGQGPACEADNFGSLASFEAEGHICIEALVTDHSHY